jgi:nucleoside-diphosphate-sugar epimerase
MARVLILGGSGFIGRHLVTYLHDNRLASHVLVADKVPYSIASLSENQLEIYKNEEFLSFKQADLRNPASVDAVFEYAGGAWDFVINLAAVTKYSQAKEVYDANIVAVSTVCSAAAAKFGVKRFIEVSTSQVYESKNKPTNEEGRLRPWTGIGVASLEAENAVRSVADLNYVIVRPAIVYGTSDITGMTPRLIIGSIYKVTGEKMTSLYTKDLRFNTVHVKDVAKALWFLCEHGDSGSVFNLADSGDTDQGQVNKILEEIYGIRTNFLNTIKMSAASAMGTKFLVGFANDQHLKPFSDACKRYEIADTPLTPYLDEELIKETPTAVDGTKITQLGFTYDYPRVTADLCREVLDDFVKKGYFPPQLLQ